MKKTRGSKQRWIGKVADDIEAYMSDLKRRKCTESTIKTRQYALKKLRLFLARRRITRSSDVLPEHLEEFRAQLKTGGLSPMSIDVNLRGARSFFRYLEKNNRIFADPTENMIIYKTPDKRQPVPTEEEVMRLLNAPNLATPYGIRDRAMLEVIYSGGLRLGELLGLRVHDPDFNAGTVRIMGKGRKERVIPLGRKALHWLKLYIGDVRPKLLGEECDEESLWITRFGECPSGVLVQSSLRRYTARAGIDTPISPHALRRACATHMLNNGAHPVHIQMLLGHSTLDSLGQYLAVSIRDLRKAHARVKPGG